MALLRVVLDDHVASGELEPVLEVIDHDVGATGVDRPGGRDRTARLRRIALDQHEPLGLHCRFVGLTAGRTDGRRAQQRSCQQDGGEHADARSGHQFPRSCVEDRFQMPTEPHASPTKARECA